jgi:hypothetical protein
MKKKTAVIVGTGIAGLSLAEILSRNNYKIILLESQDGIGGEASLATQKWYHSGWLYAALPNPAAMMGCYNALHLYKKIYHDVLPGSINLDLDGKNVEYLEDKDGWFTDERIHYLYAMGAHEFSLAMKLYWPIYFSLFPMRRLRKLYNFKRMQNIDRPVRELLNFWEKNKEGYKRYRCIKTTDAKIQTELVTRALVSALSNDTEIITNASFSLNEGIDGTSIKIDEKSYTPDLLVLASGKSIPTHLKQIDKGKIASMIKSVKSPIVILKEELDLPDFIRFTPNLPHTINHIKFDINGFGKFSTLGSYYSFPVDENPDISFFENLMCARFGKTKADVLDSYYGIKTEFVGQEKRRYNHSVMRVNQNTFFALAGKFCQFPLLVHDFVQQMELSLTPRSTENRIQVDERVFSATYPKTIVSNYIRNKQSTVQGAAR